MKLPQPIRTLAREAELLLWLNRYLRNIDGAVVVTYHGVEPREQVIDPVVQSLHIDPAELKRQVEFLARNFELVDRIDEERLAKRTGRPLALITFDDGYKNFLTHALPVLEQAGVPSTLFVTTNCVESGSRHPTYTCKALISNLVPGRYDLDSIGETLEITSADRSHVAKDLAERMKHMPWGQGSRLIAELESLFTPGELQAIHDKYTSDAVMTWDEVRRLKERGVFIGSHTLDHVVLGPGQPEEVARQQVVESRRVVEQQLGECALFAYPNGLATDISPFAAKAVEEAGYDYAFTTVPGVVRADQLQANRYVLPRLSVSDSWTGFRKYVATAWRHNSRHEAFANGLHVTESRASA